jgi:fibronectin type III domain protein
MMRGVVCLALATGVFAVAAFSALAATPISVTLAWTPSSAADIAGYRVYWGTASRSYSNMIDTGPVTVATVTPLIAGTTYYFAATSYDTTGLESPFSSEIVYTVPPLVAGVPVLHLAVNSTSQILLTSTAPVGYQYDVLASSDLISWTAIGTVAADLNGAVRFTDPRPATNAAGFYQLRQTFPLTTP